MQSKLKIRIYLHFDPNAENSQIDKKKKKKEEKKTQQANAPLRNELFWNYPVELI